MSNNQRVCLCLAYEGSNSNCAIHGVDLPKKPRGFAALDPETRRQRASMGGKAAHDKGTAHQWTKESSRVAGDKGRATQARKREEAA